MRELERQVLLAGHRPQVARAPLRDGLPPGGHRPARVRPARPAGGVPARGLRHVRPDDGRHQGGGGRLPLQPRGAGRGGRRAGRADAVAGGAGCRPEPRSRSAPRASAARRRQQALQYSAPDHRRRGRRRWRRGRAGRRRRRSASAAAPAPGSPAGRRRRASAGAAAAQPSPGRRSAATARPATRRARAARARSTSAATAPPAAPDPFHRSLDAQPRFSAGLGVLPFPPLGAAARSGLAARTGNWTVDHSSRPPRACGS